MALGPAKQRTVLAVLLFAAGRAVSRDEIIQGVWGDAAPSGAPGLVANYVARLRKLLEPSRVTRSGQGPLFSDAAGYGLRFDRERLDLWVFQDAVAAARALRKPASCRPARASSTRRSRCGAASAWTACPGRSPRPSGPGWPSCGCRRPRSGSTSRWNSGGEAVDPRALAAGRPASAPRASQSPADAGAVPLGPAGGRPRGVQRHPARAGPGSGDRAGTGAPAAAGADVRRDPGLDRSPVVLDHPIPRQVPSDIADFTGRRSELARIRAVLCPRHEPPCPRVLTISGTAGVGKTALAVHAARLLADRFPDGQLYADLHGAGSGARRQADVLAGFLAELGAERIPGDADRQEALYRTLTSGRRMLILLDDAGDAAQIRSLIPNAGGCAVLVTSRAGWPRCPGITCWSWTCSVPRTPPGCCGPSSASPRSPRNRRPPTASSPVAPGCRWPCGSSAPGPPGIPAGRCGSWPSGSVIRRRGSTNCSRRALRP